SKRAEADGGAARVEAAWSRIVEWLAERAPRSYAHLLPPASEDGIREAEAVLAEHAFFPDGGEPLTFPEELRALWRLCAGAAEPEEEIPEDEEGELWPGLVLPHGMFLPPLAAARARLAHQGLGDEEYWKPERYRHQAYAVPCVAAELSQPTGGLYIDTSNGPRRGSLGRFYALTGYEAREPCHPTVADYLEAVAAILVSGTGCLPDGKQDKPAISLGCLVWLLPDHPCLSYAPWELVHPHDR
ncbi:hypothetical protein, partial [Streptomyces uncialis]|uniref:hypothetical protein n=1 Tax=Streptomyces uncialis TaxID=1048205 RepID=UPI0037882A6F